LRLETLTKSDSLTFFYDFLFGQRADLDRDSGRGGLCPLVASVIAELDIEAPQEHGPFQPSLFDERNLLELESAHFPGERLVVYRNPLLAVARARKPLRGAQAIALRAGRVIDHYHMAKHFALAISDPSFTWVRKEAAIAAEAALDAAGIGPAPAVARYSRWWFPRAGRDGRRSTTASAAERRFPRAGGGRPINLLASQMTIERQVAIL